MMHNRKLVVLDLDDTLVDTSMVYWEARSAFVNLLVENLQADYTKVVDTFEAYDTKHIALYGLDPKRYVRSMLSTYQHFRKTADESELIMQAIRGCGEIILNRLPELLPGAISLLDWLLPRFSLALVTRGDEQLQRKKIAFHKLDRYFQKIEIVERKSADTFRAVMRSAEVNPTETWVIGDSVKSDINPALEAGANCIHYIYHHPSYHWIQEHDAVASTLCPTIRNISDAMSILAADASAGLNDGQKVNCLHIV